MRNLIIFALIAAAGLIAWQFLKPKTAGAAPAGQERAERLQEIIDAIRNDPDWYQAVIDRAHQYGMSVEDRLVKEAEYVLKNS